MKMLSRGYNKWEHIVASNRMTEILSWGDWTDAKIGKYETKEIWDEKGFMFYRVIRWWLEGGTENLGLENS